MVGFGLAEAVLGLVKVFLLCNPTAVSHITSIVSLPLLCAANILLITSPFE